jgi:uncharacterized protein (TIGR00369 family)
MADADAISTAAPRYGVVPPGARGSVPGLQFLQSMLAGELPAPPITEIMNITMESAREGEVVMHGTPQAQHLNPLGSVHGGYACTLLDSVMGCAVHTTLAAGDGYTTIELKVNLTRTILPGMRVRGIGTIINRGKQLATAEGRIFGEDGKLLAHAVTTCLVFPIDKPRTAA